MIVGVKKSRSINQQLGTLRGKLTIGWASKSDVIAYIRLLEMKLKVEGAPILVRLELEAAKDFFRRVNSSIFHPSMEFDHIGLKRLFMRDLYHNVKVKLSTTKQLLQISREFEGFLEPEFYGIKRNHKYFWTIDDLIHNLFRHNASFHIHNSDEEIRNGYQPSVFDSNLVLNAPHLSFIILDRINNDDWRDASKGTNQIVDVQLGGITYNITRKGHTNRSITFYPRNDGIEPTVIIGHNEETEQFERID